MATRKSDDAQNRYDDLVLDTLKGVEKKIDQQIRTSYKQDARLSDHESRLGWLERKLFNGNGKRKDLPPIYRDPAVIRLLTIVALTILVIALFVTKVDLGSLIK